MAAAARTTASAADVRSGPWTTPTASASCAGSSASRRRRSGRP